MHFFSYICVYFFILLWQCPVTLAETELFHVGDDVNILDPYDGAIIGTGWIQSLTKIHGVPLEEADANIVVLSTSSDIHVEYEYPMNGYERLKET